LDQLIFEVSGEEIYFRSVIFAMFIVFGIVTSRILTRRKKIEEALRDSEERFRAITSSAKDAIIMTDNEGKVSYWNSAAERMFGYTKKEAVGKEMYKLIVPKRFHEGFLTGFANFKKIGQSDLAGKPFELWAVRKDGREFQVELSVSALLAKGKKYVVGIVREITERKKAERAIRESQKKFERLFMSNPEASVYSDADDRVLDINPRFSELFGYSLDEARGQLLDDLIVPDDLKEEGKMLTEIREGYVYHDTVRKKKDGSLVPVSISSASITNENQNLGNVVLYKDITERKKMERAVERQRDIAVTLSGAGNLDEALNRLFDNLLEMEEFDCAGFYLFDKKTGELDMIAYKDLPDKFVEKVSHFDADSPYTKVVLEGKPLYQKTNDFPPPIREGLQSDGILSVAAIPIQYEGEIIGHLNLASHTSEEISVSTRQVLESVGAQIGETIVRVRMEEKLRKSEEKLKQYSEHLEELVQERTQELSESEKRYSVLVEGASDGVIIVQDGKHIFANKKFGDIVGYSKDEIIGLPMEKLVDEKYLQLIKERDMRMIQGETVPPIIEVELTTKNEEHIPIEASSTLIQYLDRPAALIIVRDIRDRKRAEETRQRLEKLAAIGELATMVGHDLRNPLQSIENATYYLKNECARKCNPIPQQAKTMLQVISNSISYADKIIRDLQDFSSIKKPTLKKRDINTIVKEALAHVKATGNVEFRKELSLLPEIEIDEDQMKRVFLNLITNAVQAMETGGKLTISTKKTSDSIEVSFRDTGIGIPKENMDKIFKPLFTTKSKGMGMGLAICKKFVEAHSGSIEVESEAAKGTTFTVKLPIQHKMEVTAIASE